MQKLILLMFGIVLSSGLVIAFLMYRQLGTGSEVLEGSPELESNGQGAECGQVAFDVQARSLGQWFFDVPKGKTITGTVTVDGGEMSDVGFSVWSPANRPVIVVSDRAHETDFEIVGTIRGEYRFDFDNRHSSFTDTSVTVALCVA